MNKIFIDFETYYDRDYSLTKMTTPEYVMHDKFKVLGLSYAINDGPVLWATELPDLDWANSEVIAHNCYFDAMILTLRYGIKARRWSCTLSISRALFPYNNSHSLKAMSGYLNIGEKGDGLTLGSSDADQKLIDYAIQDTELCRGIYNKLAHFLPESEQELLHITLRWGVEPTLVGNVEKLEVSADLEAAKRDDLILRSGLSEKVLNSNKKFEAWMVEEGLEVPMKTSKTAKITWPVPALSKNDPEFHVCVAQYPELDHVWKGRIAAKSNINILRPRTLAAVCRAIPNHGLPVPLRYAGTHTLRWSGHDSYNMQNLPNGSVSRTAIEAPKGHVIVVADSSQIELRLNAWWSKEEAVLDVLNAGKCIYIQTAAAHFGVPYETFDKSSPARKLGKAISLGCGYSMGAKKFRLFCASGPLGMDPMILTEREATEAVNTYRTNNKNIANNWKIHEQWIQAMYTGEATRVGPLEIHKGCVVLPGGAMLFYPNLEAIPTVNHWGEVDTSWQYGHNNHIYGARFQENCLGPNTEVLTSEGWIPIIKVTKAHRLWDGKAWVTHEGLIYKGVQQVINFGGIAITPEHKVMTDQWREANEITYEQATSSFKNSYRVPERELNSKSIRRLRWQERLMDMRLRMWKRMHSLIRADKRIKKPILRMCNP